MKKDILLYNIYKKNHPVIPNLVVINVFDLVYQVQEKRPEQKSFRHIKRNEIRNYLQ